MRPLHAEVIEHAHHVVHEVVEGQRTVVVVAAAVAARVPCHAGEMRRKGRQLGTPVATVAADAVHEERQGSRAREVNGQGRYTGDSMGHPHVQNPR